MTNAEITSGMLVRLKSGGRPMTVRFVCGDRASQDTGYAFGVHVDWQDDHGTPHRGVFYAEQLEEVKP